MNATTELINALASLAWPVFAFYVFYQIKGDVRGLIGRFRKGKILGQEIELEAQLDNLQVVVDAVKQVSVEGSLTPPAETHSNTKNGALRDDTTSPLRTFIELSSQLELAANNVLARTGWGKSTQKLALGAAFSKIPVEWLAGDVRVLVRRFTDVRNRIVHEYHEANEEDIIRAIHIGRELLGVLRNLPIEENRVRDIVTVYKDSECDAAFPDIRGLRISSQHMGKEDPVRIYPTSQDWYRPGQLLSWEWNDAVVYGAAWYRDVESGRIEQAWHSSMEFVGRPLAEYS